MMDSPYHEELQIILPSPARELANCKVFDLSAEQAGKKTSKTIPPE